MNILDWSSGPAFVGLVADHIWQSTLVGGAAAMLALMLRRHPHARHWIWLAASVKFLVPFATLMAIGGVVEWKAPVVSPPAAVARVVETVSQPFSGPILGAVDPLSALPLVGHSTPWPQLLLVVWVCGFAYLTVRWCWRWRHLARMASTASPVAEGRESSALRRAQAAAGIESPLRVVSTNAVIEPGVFGIIRPVLVWPREVSRHLDDVQMDAIVLHELCHVKRHDNVIACVLMVVQALFWFHPLVWWLGARLIEDRERACDDEVLRLGIDPSAYAEGLLNTCRFCLESPLACVAGVTGSDLRKRIEGIMQPRVSTRLTFWTKSVLGSTAAAIVVAPIVIGAMNVGAASAVLAPLVPSRTIAGWFGQPALSRPSLEIPRAADISAASAEAIRDEDAPLPAQVVSARSTVRASSVTPPAAPVWFTTSPDGRAMAGFGLTLRDLIRFAYAGNAGPLMKGQALGGPAWADTRRFDVLVTSTDGSPVTLVRNANNLVVDGSGLTLLRQVLAERFQLTVHFETQNTPVYDLISVSGIPGADLRKGDRCEDSAVACGFRSGPGFIAARGVTMEQLAQHLASSFPAINRPVRNKTGLNGNFDITLSFTPAFLWSPQTGEPNVANPNAGAGVSLFAALEQRLGLKLQEQTDTLDVAVVDSAGTPQVD